MENYLFKKNHSYLHYLLIFLVKTNYKYLYFLIFSLQSTLPKKKFLCRRTQYKQIQPKRRAKRTLNYYTLFSPLVRESTVFYFFVLQAIFFSNSNKLHGKQYGRKRKIPAFCLLNFHLILLFLFLVLYNGRNIPLNEEQLDKQQKVTINL